MSKQAAAPGIDMASAIEHARAAIGTAGQVDSLKVKLAAGLAAHSGGATSMSTHAGTGAASTQTRTLVSLGKACVFSAALGAAGTVAWFATHEGDSAAAPRATSPATVAPVTSEPPAAAPQPPAAPPASSDAPIDDAPAASHPPSRPSAARARLAKPAAASRTSRTPRGDSPANAPPAPASEVELISRAQGLVDSQPSAALAALREHEVAYPSGMLREEREVLRIDAEWALGSRDSALAHARAFLLRYPHSTQARRFETLLSDHKNELDTTPTE
jgi:hypothetical protein